jgi:hypothetical protein
MTLERTNMPDLTVDSRCLLVALALTAGCGAHAPTPHAYRYAELVRNPETGRHIFEQPIILEFQPGDRLPIELGFQDAAFALEPSVPQLSLIAKERCFVRIDGRGIRTSRDRAGFDEKPAAPGSFFFGFAHRATGPALSVQVKTPRRSRK